MDVPALFAYPAASGLEVRDSFLTVEGVDDGVTVIPFADAIASLRGESRKPLMVVDGYSVGNRVFDENVLKNMRARGSDIWFMTHVEYVEDVFDAFNTVAEMVFAPLHRIHDRHEFEDILSVSDSFVPSIFVRNGRALSIDRRFEDIVEVIEGISDVGCCRMCIVDTDGSIPGDTWEMISDEHPALIPFVRHDMFEVGFGDFRTTIRSVSLQGSP